MNEYLEEFLLLFCVNSINVISPGASCAIVVRNTSSYSRVIGIMTALGVIVSSIIQKLYIALGCGVLIVKYPYIFSSIKFIGGLHLLYLAYICFTSICLKSQNTLLFQKKYNQNANTEISKRSAFRAGFLTDALNPQAYLGFASILIATVKHTTPFTIKMFYIVPLLLFTTCWYIGIALLISKINTKSKLGKYAKQFLEAIMGVTLLCLGLKMLFF